MLERWEKNFGTKCEPEIRGLVSGVRFQELDNLELTPRIKLQ